MSRTALLLVGVTLFAIAGTLLWRSFATPVLPANEEQLTVRGETTEDETTVYKIDVQYPQFAAATGTASYTSIDTINAEIRRDIDGAVGEIKSYPTNPRDMASPQNELTIRYGVPYIGPDVISIRLSISQYTGGAHPNTLLSGMNFDRASGKRLLQDDALKLIGKTITEISSEATAQLKAKLGDAMFEEGANTNPENFSSFTISQDAVTFIFQPYQVASYAAGPQEVSLPRVHQEDTRKSI
ncbi:MAG: endo,4-beta-xylanase-like protein [Candidatus Parcubacteria bacterium]|jgi:hypothetical protein